MLTTPRLILLLLATALAAPAGASAADRLAVDVSVTRFAMKDGRVVARGAATARQTSTGARLPVTQKRDVTLTVAQNRNSCRVLSLQLDDLNLQLLGLRVDASAINLQITGQRNGGALGQLFCRLATGLKLGNLTATKSAVRSLNRGLARRPMRVISFQAAMTPTATERQAAPGTCEVLELLLGPLNLDLLGLVVDLYGETRTRPVRVLVTADPSKGVLGGVFCRLASGQAVG